MKELLKTWINGDQEYHTGVFLYNKYGSDTTLKQYFRSGNTPARKERLVKELTYLFQAGENSLPDEKDLPELSHSLAPLLTGDNALLELHNKKVLLHKQKDALRYQLESFPSDRERGIAAFQIIQLRREITAIWELEAYYKAHNHLPDRSGSIITSLQDLKYHRNRINGNLRRVRSRLTKDPSNHSLQSSLSKWKEQYEQIVAQIKNTKSVSNE